MTGHRRLGWPFRSDWLKSPDNTLSRIVFDETWLRTRKMLRPRAVHEKERLFA